MELENAPALRGGTEEPQNIFIQVLCAQVIRYERLFRQHCRRMEVTQFTAFTTSLLCTVLLVEQQLYGYLFISTALVFLGYFKASAVSAESFALAAHKFFLEEELAAAWRTRQALEIPLAAPVAWDLAGGYLSRRFISGTIAQGLYILSAAAIIAVSAAVPWVHHAIPAWASMLQVAASVLLCCLGALAFRDHLVSYHQTLERLASGSAGKVGQARDTN